MRPYQQLVMEEKKELDEKLGTLDQFMLSGDFEALPEAEQVRLTRQAAAMDDYATVLAERIAAFKG